MEKSLPKKFKISQFELYDGTIDPAGYPKSIKTIMLLQGVLEAIMSMLF